MSFFICPSPPHRDFLLHLQIHRKGKLVVEERHVRWRIPTGHHAFSSDKKNQRLNDGRWKMEQKQTQKIQRQEFFLRPFIATHNALAGATSLALTSPFDISHSFNPIGLISINLN
jgi:hypothetical protein